MILNNNILLLFIYFQIISIFRYYNILTKNMQNLLHIRSQIIVRVTSDAIRLHQ